MTDPVRFDTKIAVLLRDDLAAWQRLNATAFLISAVAGSQPQLLGEPYVDADGNAYLPMLCQPVMVLMADGETLSLAHERALRRGLAMSIFTEQLFATGNDADNRAAVVAVRATDLALVGLGLFGPRNAVDKTVKGSRMHP